MYALNQTNSKLLLCALLGGLIAVSLADISACSHMGIVAPGELLSHSMASTTLYFPQPDG